MVGSPVFNTVPSFGAYRCAHTRHAQFIMTLHGQLASVRTYRIGRLAIFTSDLVSAGFVFAPDGDLTSAK